MMPAPLFFAAALVCASPVAVDGDTLHCGNIGQVRLLGIDAPELPGHCRAGRVCTAGDGFASQRALAALLRRGEVRCLAEGRDRYDRLLARCVVIRRSSAPVDLSCTMIAAGQAVRRYSRLECGQ